tara:strand:+ start:965 stop:1300 length:336 start_codon:yes stop_codon:yes gene_type:complete
MSPTYKKKTFRKKKFSKRSFKKSKKVKLTLKKKVSKRKSLKKNSKSIKNKKIMKLRKKLKGGKLNPLVPLPLREFGDFVSGSIEDTSDIYNGTSHAIERSPVDGHFQHNNY